MSERTLEICELHDLPHERGHLCPQCQRTDTNMLRVLRDLNDIKKRLSVLESALLGKP